MKALYQIPQGMVRSLPQAENSDSSNRSVSTAEGRWACASPYLEVALDKLGHGVVVDIQGQCDMGLSLEMGSLHRGHPGYLG